MVNLTQIPSSDFNLKELLTVLDAYRKGDFSVRMPNDLLGLPGKVADTLNDIIDRGVETATEFERVAQIVGTQGKLDERIKLPNMKGSWRKLVDSSNALANNLVSPMNEMIRVVGAVAKGDLSHYVPMEIDGIQLQGQYLKSAQIVNTMVTQLNSFASEVTRVAREVGTDGKLGGQAEVKGVSGTWKDLTDNVNAMASNLTGQVRNIAQVTTAVANGDLSKKITVDVKGEILDLKNTVNTMVDQLNSFASEVTRVAREVGTDGKLGGQAEVKGVSGTWKDLTDNVNAMASNLTGQVRNIAQVVTAVANGNLKKKLTVETKGEIAELADTINNMTDTLALFADQVTSVAREVGVEGKLGGQAEVKGVSGTWKDLTDNVNAMTSNLTGQVRNIAQVTTAVANGDLSKKITVDVKGEILDLKNTVNTMVDQLNSFASEVTRVAREVGTDGKLGGQANVPGASGTWKDLIGNVNQLAANLTTQVRAIANVATAVTKGDLTRSITVETRGEVTELKDNINMMIGNLRETAERNQEQDWLKTNLARFTGMLHGQRDLAIVGQMLLSELAPVVNALRGTSYHMVESHGSDNDSPTLKLLSSYAAFGPGVEPQSFNLGEGLIGQCALTQNTILLQDAPPSYIRIHSSLGEVSPQHIIVLPVLFEGQTKAVIELAALKPFTPTHLNFLEQLTQSIGVVLNTIETNMRTEALLRAGALQNAIFNSANFSSIATDAKGVVQIFNVGAERMLGYTAAEVMNKFTPADISDPLEVIARAEALSVELATTITPGFEALVFKASREIEDIYELTYIRKDGSRFPAVVSVTALRDAQDTIIGYLLIGTDNTARKQAEEALLRAGALQNAIFNSANFSSIATDAKGVIQIFNVGAERMLGYTAAEVMNKITPAEISDPLEVIARAEALSVELATPITPGFEALVFKASRGIEDIYELTYIRRDGSRFPAVVSVTALRDAQDTIIGYLLIGTDNTARKEAEADKNKLQQDSRIKSEFLANMSHELRTPLNGIIGFAEFLSDGKPGALNAKQKEYLLDILNSGRHLLHLINDVLDLAKIEAGKMELNPESFTLAHAISEVCAVAKPIAQKKHIQVNVKVAPELSSVMLDQQKFKQVLYNLISNSIKFTDDGGDVEISATPLDARRFKLAVKDTGIGIKPEDMKRLFREFEQLESGASRRYEGTGLGLALTRKLIELHSGSIGAESKVGKGSTFSVILPLVLNEGEP